MPLLDEPVQLDFDFAQDRHRLYERLRIEAPVCQAVLPRGLSAWLVTRYADAKALLADPRLSKDNKRVRELFQESSGNQTAFASSIAAHMLNMDPPDHTRLRKLVNKAFTARTVSRLRPRIEQIADELLDSIAAAGGVDLLEAYAFPLPITVICELLGVAVEDRDKFRTWSNTVVSAASPEQLQEHSAALAGYLAELIASKRAHPTDDLLSDLVHVSDAGDQLSEIELISMAFLLLVAGHETTVNLIGNGMRALLERPDQLAALRADPSLLPNAVEEFLRFDGPVNVATLRFTTEPVPVGDAVIPANRFVMVSLLGANRDGEKFEDPHKLDITRPTGGHLAFGHGIHYCVGAPLARLEAEIAIGKLLARFGTIELDGAPGGLRWRDSTLMNGLETLPVRVA
ncbi:cytochrome P450 family protein [Amycolatopsis alkalitolerans]|uniref:Cytochrome P450 n=1 Tax=Amycolatopsis alkalitolerans TaxID=2547244 RepID=A0A5C4LY88_9PSEU|nr:cytochrome P450 [Amycolatopsis alkalitolerans]TNC23896.1 cytochrome P450 [Amycolatopsis alkalitolerans]